jgi:hypothetical protein
VADRPEPELRADTRRRFPYRALQRLRGQLEGLFEYGADELPAEEFRTWRLCTLLRCPPTVLEDQPAVTLDWLLATDDIVTRARNNMEKRAARG